MLPYSQAPNWLAISTEKPDVLINAPSESIVVEIKAAEIVPSTAYACGSTLRFPRFLRQRQDKAWNQCMTMADVAKLRALGEGKLQSRTLASVPEEPSKKVKRPIAVRKGLSVPATFIAADLSQVSVQSKIFDKLEFYVLNGSASKTKQDLEKDIKALGGSLVQSALPSTFAIICGKGSGMRFENIKKSNCHDMIKSEWIEECLQRQEFIPLEPR